MFPRKTFWAMLGAVASGVAGAAMAIFGINIVFIIGIGAADVAVALACCGFAHYEVNTSDIFSSISTPSRGLIKKLIDAAIFVNVAVSVLAGITVRVDPVLIPLWLVALAALAAVEYVGARINERIRSDKAKIKAREELEKREREEQQRQKKSAELEKQKAAESVYVPDAVEGASSGDQNPIEHLRESLERIQMDYLIIIGWDVVADSTRAFGVRYRVRVPAHKINSDGKLTLTAGHAEPIAAAMTEVLINNAQHANQKILSDAHALGQSVSQDDLYSEYVEILTEWVGVTKQKGAGAYTLTVVNEDIMGRTFGFEDDFADFENRIPRERSITDPVLVGYNLEAKPHYKDILIHEAFVGATRSGKSSLMHAILAHTTACTDSVDWICGVEKLFDLLDPWCSPYRGTREEIPFDWVACGPEDSARMLSLAMSIARWRQRQPMEEREGYVKVIVWMDEATSLLKHKHAKALYDGQELDASQLAEEDSRGAAGSGIVLKLALQKGTNDKLGQEGAGIAANLQARSVFESGDAAEVGRTFSDHSLKQPTNKGEYWTRLNPGELPTRLKAPYIQTNDPQQPKLLPNGPRISDVAWRRRHIRKGMDKATAAAIPSMRYGEMWTDRYRMADDVLAYVNGNTADTPMNEDGPSDLDREAQKLADAAIAEVDSEMGLGQRELESPKPTAMPVGAPAPQSPKLGVKEAIYQHVAGEEEPQGRGEIVRGVSQQRGKDVNPQQVTNHLGELVNEGRLSRTDDQRYEVPQAASVE